MEDAQPTPPPLPVEAERRVVEDADARGVPVRLHGGGVWFIPPLPLSPRGQRIAGLMDDIQRAEVDLAAAQRRVSLATKALDEAGDLPAVEAAQAALHGAVRARDADVARVQTAQASLAYDALRCHYRVTPEEASALVTQRAWSDVLAALNGQDTEEAEHRTAFALLARLREAGKEGGESADPFARRSGIGSGGPGVS